MKPMIRALQGMSGLHHRPGATRDLNVHFQFEETGDSKFDGPARLVRHMASDAILISRRMA